MKLVFAFNLSRVYEHYKRKRFAIVSAYLMESDPAVNLARANALKQVVRARGYGYVEMEGHWIETSGKHKGEELLEYPLFIPEVAYEDAAYFGSGAYYTPDPKMQQAIIFADGEKIQMLSSTPDGKWVVDFSFDNLQANLEESLKRWHAKRAKLAEEKAKGMLGPSETVSDDEYMGWSVLNPRAPKRKRPWRFSTVTISMVEPPDPNESGSWGGSMKKAYWSDRRPHDFYRPTAQSTTSDGGGGGGLVRYRGVLYKKLHDTPPRKLPKQVVAILRRKFKFPTFSSSLNIPQKITRNWDLNPKNVLLSTKQFAVKRTPIGRFAWHPISGEFIFADISEQHAITIHSFGSHPFDEYVRGIVLHGKKLVALRPWVPNFEELYMTTGDPAEDRANAAILKMASQESQEACKRTITTVGGVPASWSWRFDISNTDLQKMTGVFRW